MTADQAERPLESSLPLLLSHCLILLSQRKEFTLQEGRSGDFLCLSSVISLEQFLPPPLAEWQEGHIPHASEGAKEGPGSCVCI